MLHPGELITGIEVPHPAPQSAYVKIRERKSFEYALVSAAVTVELEEGVLRRAKIALGSVALRPWRLDVAEAALIGLAADSPLIQDVVDRALDEARPLPHNGLKLRLARGAILRALQLAVVAPAPRGRS